MGCPRGARETDGPSSEGLLSATIRPGDTPAKSAPFLSPSGSGLLDHVGCHASRSRRRRICRREPACSEAGIHLGRPSSLPSDERIGPGTSNMGKRWRKACSSGPRPQGIRSRCGTTRSRSTRVSGPAPTSSSPRVWRAYVLAMTYWAIDVKGYRRWATPFLVFGTNSIAARKTARQFSVLYFLA